MKFSSWTLVSLCVPLLWGPALAEEHEAHDHDEHIVASGEISVSHPWARAAGAGEDTLVFMEFDNQGAVDTLKDVHVEIARTAKIVGVIFPGGEQSLHPLGEFDLPSGSFDFDPAGVAILLEGLSQSLAEGDKFELELIFHTAGELHLHVEVEAANANQHSHSGHVH